MSEAVRYDMSILVSIRSSLLLYNVNEQCTYQVFFLALFSIICQGRTSDNML
jgi:hypothetical protein